MIVRRGGKPGAGRVEVAREQFPKGGGCVEGCNAARAVERVADVVEPENFAVRGVEERDAETAEVEGAVGNAAGVAFGLAQYVLRAQCDLLGLDNAEQLADGEGVVSRAVGGRKLREGVVRVSPQRAMRVERSDHPAARRKLRVDPFLAGCPFGLRRR